jgi:AraC family transcriptional regulator, exoenzyme S synthesis regulatory protein ExsA
MKHSTDIVPGGIVYSMITEKEREWNGFLSENIFVLQISGKMTVETSSEKFSTQPGDMLLTRKNQLAKIAKMPFDREDYQTIIILLNGDILRRYALKHGIEIKQKYKGKLNIFIPKNEFLQGFFKSLMPYGDKSQTRITNNLGQLKLEEAIELLLYSMPQLKEFLFDFSEPHKIDLEKFMTNNFQFNVPVEKFARLSGRSLAGFKRDFKKTFSTSPRQWLQEKRLAEAHYLIEKKRKKPSEIYLDLGFESLSHFSFAFEKLYGYAPTQLLLNSARK